MDQLAEASMINTVVALSIGFPLILLWTLILVGIATLLVDFFNDLWGR